MMSTTSIFLHDVKPRVDFEATISPRIYVSESTSLIFDNVEQLALLHAALGEAISRLSNKQAETVPATTENQPIHQTT